MTAGRRPIKRVIDANGNELATLAEIAREINDRFPPVPGRQPVSRQLLHKSWQNRERSRGRDKFPEPTKMLGSANGGKGSPLWYVEAVVEWYAKERRYRIGDHHNHNEEESALAA